MPNEAADSTPRRTFLSRLAAATAAFGMGTVPSSAFAAPSRPEGRAKMSESVPEDEPWMQRLSGTQRVLFHSHEATNGTALTWARTFLETHKNSYGRTDKDCGVVVGLNGKAIGLVFNDALWAKYPIANTLAMTGATAASANPNTSAVAQLLQRGVIVLVCNNSLRASGQRFLPEAQRGDAAARTAFAEEARANLLPGVEVVPAMIVTLQMAQDRGCRYVYAGG
jgi:intracellular sulfur oxidation DsrE/DsrF family protein